MEGHPIKSNIHTHTIYSDGQCTPEEMVRAAIAKGFHTLGFSEHAPFLLDKAAMKQEAAESCKREIRRLQTVYRDQIHILYGQEHDFVGPAFPEETDYTIESVHGFNFDGGYQMLDHTRELWEEHKHIYFGDDPYAMCKAYFELICASCCVRNAQIIGHMELIMKFNEKRDLFDDNDPRYLASAREAVHAVAEAGKIAEINTGAMARGLRTEPAPCMNVMKMLHEAKARVMINSDSHFAEMLDTGFETAKEMLRAAGFKSVLAYRGKALEEVSIL